ncbi:uncharacterized protein PV06_03896 [Exophiala oligosperma]|uniref:Uncharacterized protein n=1 Tax=Exophiala oligosperma TaxID=215243 RepID=A0A0D2DSU7_9EURO|nr:uncharacterized protein PV06_03896 [Exophiala oligosperma]KIW45510.1 hypothetical protein PV06_03896 [Exophiala oligosperma]
MLLSCHCNCCFAKRRTLPCVRYETTPLHLLRSWPTATGTDVLFRLEFPSRDLRNIAMRDLKIKITLNHSSAGGHGVGKVRLVYIYGQATAEYPDHLVVYLLLNPLALVEVLIRLFTPVIRLVFCKDAFYTRFLGPGRGFGQLHFHLCRKPLRSRRSR